MNKNFENKVVIITGSSRGIGGAIAKEFADAGAKLMLVARTEEKLKNLAQNLKADYLVADVGNEEDMERVAVETIKKFGRIDVLIHNAGIYPTNPFIEMQAKDWHKVINTNLNSAFYIVKACTPHMIKQNYGRIVFTSSISGPQVGLPAYSHYTASKAGLNGFMKTIAIELAKYNITVNAVEPGNILTESFDDLGEEHFENMKRAIPMGKLGRPVDVARAHLFLASDNADFITGQSIIVDGGQLLPESQYMKY